MVAVPLMFASNNPAWRILPLVNLRLVHLVFLLRLSSILLVHDSVLAALSLWQPDGLQWIRIHIAGINLVLFFFLFLFFFQYLLGNALGGSCRRRNDWAPRCYVFKVC